MEQNTIAITEKIKKLLRLANNNNNLEESALALAKATALMEAHNIESVDYVEKTERIVYDLKQKKLPAWKQELMAVLGQKTGVIYTFQSRYGYKLYGTEKAIESFMVLIKLCEAEIDRLCLINLNFSDVYVRNSYKLGCVHAIDKAIKKELEEVRKTYDATTRDLVINAHALTVADFRAKNPKAKTRSVKTQYIDATSYAKGRKDGSGIYGINKPKLK